MSRIYSAQLCPHPAFMLMDSNSALRGRQTIASLPWLPLCRLARVLRAPIHMHISTVVLISMPARAHRQSSSHAHAAWHWQQSTPTSRLDKTCDRDVRWCARHAAHRVRMWWSVSRFAGECKHCCVRTKEARQNPMVNCAISLSCIRTHEWMNVTDTVWHSLPFGGLSPMLFAWHSTTTTYLRPFCTKKHFIDFTWLSDVVTKPSAYVSWCLYLRATTVIKFAYSR